MVINFNNAIKNLRKFFISEWFMAILFIISAFITIFEFQIVGTLIFICLISVLLVICDDLLSTTLPFFLLSVTSIKLHNSYNDFIKYWWIVILLVFALIFHFIVYRKKKIYKKGTMFLPVLAVAIAVTFNGAGIITAKEYFSGVAIFNTIALGFGALLTYYLMVSSFNPNNKYDFTDKFTKIMITVLVYCCFMVVHHYLINIETFINNPRVLQFQWRNNVSTFIMLTMPFAFYRTIKKPLYMSLGLFSYFVLLLAGSRGGMLFGGIELLVCIIAVIILDKNRRKIYLALLGVIALVSLAFILKSFNLLTKTFERFTSHKENFRRMGLWENSVKDFISNPITGRGLGYMGNRYLHKSVKFSLCWYHSSVFQIIGSFGILGILAYGYQYYARIKLFMSKRKNVFNIFLFIAYLGIEMMSLVNPGVFCPIPYLTIVILYFVVLENCTTETTNKEYEILKKD